jgi:hypothetical protein
MRESRESDGLIVVVRIDRIAQSPAGKHTSIFISDNLSFSVLCSLSDHPQSECSRFVFTPVVKPIELYEFPNDIPIATL